MTDARGRMVVSTALLIRERGAHATAIADVLEHSGAPRGSAYHYFPGGRSQLLSEAVDYAADHIARTLAEAPTGVAMLDTVATFYRRGLLDSDYRAGCPVLAVAVEAGDPDAGTATAVDRAAAAFQRWQTLIAQRLVTDGIAEKRAAELATLALSSLEGALVLARAARATEPLDVVHRQLRDLIHTATPERKPRR